MSAKVLQQALPTTVARYSISVVDLPGDLV